ncbi:hypothetical protein F4779DRAFT_525316 [Xylariaceae sp. FL0662B]|nr:hypothetical protein F4779DRAFT_525316 [Xylariaceae sp. FL0662B]
MSVVDGVVVAIPPPEGVEVDFVNPKRNGTTAMYLVFSVGMIVSHLFLGQNLYVKLWLRRRVDIEVYMVILAEATSLATQGLLLYAFIDGLIGVHAWEIPLEKFAEFAKMFFITPILFCPLVAFSKLALALFYRSLSPQWWWKWSIAGIIAFIIGYNIAIFFALLFACTPVQKSWDITLTTGSCLDRPSIYVSQVAFGTVSDVLLFIIPIPMVVQLRITRAQKVGILGVFAFGLVTVITGIVRIIMLLLPNFTSTDQTWVVPPPIIVSIAEINLLIACATLPTLKGFFRHVAPGIFGEMSSRGYKRTYDNSKDNYRRDVQTIGGGGYAHGKSGARTDEERLSDEDGQAYDMKILSRTEPAIATVKETTTHSDSLSNESVVLSENRTWDPRSHVRDSDAIVQTRTITVEYSDGKNHPPGKAL